MMRIMQHAVQSAQGGNAEMDRISRQALLVFNEAMKRVDEVYRSAVKQYGMSEP